MKKSILIIFCFIFLIKNINPENNIKFFRYESFYFKNGLKLYVVERKELPLVSMGILIKSGAYHEEKPGVANLLASSLIYGNEYMRSNEVISTLDYLGANISINCDYDNIELKASMLLNTTERVIKIISRIIKYPIFDNKILHNFKNRTMAALKAEKDNISLKARMEFYKLIYGDHPYSKNISGDEDSLKNITRDDLFNYYKKYFVPNNAAIVLVGNITLEKAKKIIYKYFSDWQEKDLPQEKKYKLPEIQKRINIINYPVTQGFVRMGHVSFSRNNPLYHKLFVYNEILGGSGFGSRLTKIIREKYGLTYGIISYFYVYRKHEGYFHINFSTDLSKVKFAVKEIYKILDEYIKNGPHEEELSKIKSYLNGIYIMSIETPEDIISTLFSMELYALKPYFWEEDIKIINSLTLKDLKELGKYIKKDLFSIVVVIDKSKVDLKEEDLNP